MAPSNHDALTIARICRVNHVGKFGAIPVATEIFIWLSTGGDTTRMARALLHKRQQR